LLSAFGEGNFFIELTALDDDDLVTLSKLAELAGDLGIPIVAANDVLYAEAAGARTAGVLAAIRDRGSGLPAGRSPHPQAGTRDPRSPEVGTERYMKTTEQMGELFGRYPQAI